MNVDLRVSEIVAIRDAVARRHNDLAKAHARRKKPSSTLAMQIGSLKNVVDKCDCALRQHTAEMVAELTP